MRHFYRCTGCLEIVTLADRLPMEFSHTVAQCAICRSHFEYMGRTERDRLVTDVTACKCDDRCTSARGPMCTCKCQGENHGAGLAGYVTQTVDCGPIPIVHPANATRSAKALAGFEAYREVRDRVLAEVDGYSKRKRAGEYLPYVAFTRMRILSYALQKAYKARTQASRIKALSTALAA